MRTAIIEHEGRRQTARQWARELGLSREEIYRRLRTGAADWHVVSAAVHDGPVSLDLARPLASMREAVGFSLRESASRRGVASSSQHGAERREVALRTLLRAAEAWGLRVEILVRKT